MTGPRGADGSLRANRFGSVATKHEGARTAYVVALPDLPGGGGPATAAEQLERLRELFAQARSYVDRQDQATQAGQRPVLYDPTLEALIPYARREQPVILGANSAAGILVAIDLAAELDILAILRGGQEAWRVADEISEAGLPVLLSPLTRSPSDPYDPYDSVHQSPLRLHEAGILFGFQSNSGAGSRELPFHAGMAVAFGLPPEVALRSVTLSTAEILGIDDQVGSLDVGKRVLAFGARGINADLGALNAGSTDLGYRVNGTYVDKFFNDTLGVALAASYVDEPYQTQEFNSWGYAGNGTAAHQGFVAFKEFEGHGQPHPGIGMT